MTAPLPIGELRHGLTLERAVVDDDETSWTAVDTVFAAITPLSAGETIAGDAPTGTAGLRIEMRWRADVTSRDRLRLGDRVFRIVAARDLDERRRRLVVLAEEEGR
ncbi:MAG: phage head closure protein [Siculibacillus sp.]|nr:phage head closure protein [Siculibacillus sp.]